jgi:hypothetical protein
MYKFIWKKNINSKTQKYDGFIDRGNMRIIIAIINKKGKSWDVDWATDKVEDTQHKSLQVAKDYVESIFNKTNK